MSYHVLLSPAKLNLTLRVLRKREDGYHEIESLIQKISLYDILKIKIFKKKTTIENIEFYPKNLDISIYNNTIKKTIDVIKFALNVNFGYDIKIYKKIPIKSGLGGGSSNAGILIKYLNEILRFNLNCLELYNIGKEIGADVPVFVNKKSLLLVKGIGDKVINVNFKNPYSWYILVKPKNISLSTKEVYNSLNLVLTNQNKSIIEKKNIECGVNDLEKAAFKLAPQLRELKEFLKKYSNLVLMSGSGSVIYCGFKDKNNLLNTYKKIKDTLKSHKIIICRNI